jgi:hypothetical protein
MHAPQSNASVRNLLRYRILDSRTPNFAQLSTMLLSSLVDSFSLLRTRAVPTLEVFVFAKSRLKGRDVLKSHAASALPEWKIPG